MTQPAFKDALAQTGTGEGPSPLLRGFEASKEEMPDWVRALKDTAAAAFSLPTPAREGWTFTNLRAIAKETFDPSLAATLRVTGAKAAPLGEAFADETVKETLPHAGEMADYPFAALNAAHFTQGLFLRLSGKTEETIEIVIDTPAGALSCPRIVIVMEKGAEAKIVLRETGKGSHLSAPVTDIVMNPLAKLEFYRFQSDAPEAFSLHTVFLRQDEKSDFSGFTLNAGARISRLELRAQLLGREVSCKMKGVYTLKDRQVGDTTLVVDHFEPQCQSLQKFKGVIDAEARAIFQGKIHVRRAAQKTDGYQLNHALLLSDAAEADAKPELEIYADDVKCSHGSATFRLDPDALFYLRARGVPEPEARLLLIRAFLHEDISEITDEKIRAEYEGAVDAWLTEALHGRT